MAKRAPSSRPEAPSPETPQRQATGLARELDWLQAIIQHRFNPATAQDALPPPPPLKAGDGPYAAVCATLGLVAEERLILILALTPQVAPEQLDPFLLRNQATGRPFTEFGGLTGQVHAGFLPTAETALFLLAGRELELRLHHRRLLAPDGRLAASGLIELDLLRQGDEPPLSAALRPGAAWLERLLSGDGTEPRPTPGFPATPVTTALSWEDLVLDPKTLRQIGTIQAWLRHAPRLMKDPALARRLKPGYRCLFHGPPGTGKTLTACLLGKMNGRPVYRVDLSRVVSKWIGETEKNLASLFDQAQHRDWILFFDEAESLFSKRTETRSSNDRSANQQVAYLLQRLEDFPGLAILATNHRSHMDEAFDRRFQSSILFPTPDADARQRLWQDSLRNDFFRLAEDVDLVRLAADHVLTGGAITNVLRHVCLVAAERPEPVVTSADLSRAIREELQKEGRYAA
ncbi:ATP-binding protein [Nitrospirillum iridis]|uniref:AAA+ ATPase domain-containing protein n=1 Tax=Nitrospirillum iridis TaxID=765888 RepID=A0A7X0AVB4_9PROT|nr:ATP-binding protein [Nitrospirillum iridis]MBB6250758.1 hypothetical protein [Nitrospirillum iridis]